MINPSNRQTKPPRIAIAGATGRVGMRLINQLAPDPVTLVALSRQQSSSSSIAGVASATVDFDQPSTLEKALAGVDKLFITHGTSAQQVANEIALIDAAVEAGVQHIVKISVMGPSTPVNPFAWHSAIEAHLARQPLASTVLRPTTFMDVLKRAGNAIAAGTWAGAAGDGRVNLIDTRDVADCSRIALLEEVEKGSRRAYHLTGPGNWTMPQIAEQLSVLLGHAVSYTHRTPAAQYAALVADGRSRFEAELLVGLDRIFHDCVLTERTFTVEDLTGTAPRSLSDWLRENLDAFRRQVR
ncbi:NAD(P)H-binding protein [Pseudomonas alliivorans]|nr:NAD(P)H-binding protein [Pseudomonas alliivorans]MEE4794158.1 NAD(P)H-binding protein [Pseudomonas alliivorans]MEE4798490.1 NAD(P)H-binding protein [Pseudomonas alliivorans]MEE4808809.1 NAD(P)H-binding protein [Pseudomonas alliivorans]MEE4823793.1 NAD(P)H-binding protein [Pseudomonas alliivorans]